MTDRRTLYDEDFTAWTEQQAEALRAAGRGGSNQQLDWHNLAEEIESLGRSDRRELHSQVYRIVLHLAKLQFSTAAASRRGWHESIEDARRQIELIVADSPSLKPEIDQIVADETTAALRRAARELADFDEVDAATRQALRHGRYTAEQVLGDWFPREPTGPL
jgi:hypothetical protein